MPTRLPALDLALIGVYLIGITLFGLRFRRTDTSLSSYFLAARAVPWWAIALSIVSAETSTLTIISVPGLAFGGNFTFLQLVFGYMIGRVLLCVLFLPRYFDGELFTAYQLIDRRFGPTLHKVTAGLFLLTRAAAEGVRVFAVSIVVGIAIGTNDVVSIILISLLTLVYTFEGGMTAVIWTDVVQMFLYVAGTVVALFTLGSHIDGGWATVHAVTSAAGKLHMFDFTLNLTTAYTFWAGVLGGAFLTMASHGTDQLMVQRLLAARNLRDSRIALLASGGVVLMQFTLFLVIGAGLYVFYAQHPASLTTHAADRIFPSFIVQQMPTGVAGLLIAAILAAAMSNLSAALNSLASTTVVDFYLRLRPNVDVKQRTRVSRSATILWAIILVAIAIYSVANGGKGHVVETGLSIASVAYGSLLGVFLLGTLTKYATESGAIVGMVVGFALNLALWLQPAAMQVAGVTVPKVAFTWYVLIGSAVTFAVGSLASVVLPKKRNTTVATLLALAVILPAMCGAQTPPPRNFSAIDATMNDAVATNQLPGGVVLVGHGGHVVYHKAFGSRAVDPAVEAMTEDTVFDMASLSKCLSTATAIMQLVEQGKVNVDDAVVKYLPDFAANGKNTITIRQLLTHYSGLKEDVQLTDAWSGKAEGILRAMQSAPYGPPGVTFRYSDINYITLGAIVEKVSGEPLDVYAKKHIFAPLHMTATTYLPSRADVAHIAPTAHNDDKPMADDRLLRGEVHDPTTRRMGGVAGHAGVFSTAADTALFAQALLDRLAGRASNFPLKTETLRLMCEPQQPPRGKALRGFGWDIDSGYSRPRGDVFPVGSFGHTGFTGTSLWMDPWSNSYVILLANAIHPRGRPAITALRGRVATAAASALNLNEHTPVMTGIDVLEATGFAALRSLKPRDGKTVRIGLLTNQTGIDARGKRTVDVLHAIPANSQVMLTTLFSPEHGIAGVEDREGIASSIDTATDLPVISLYGNKPIDQRPKVSDLQKLDAVVIDLQDAGVRFYTYETVVGYFLEAAAKAGTAIIVLDRPALLSGARVDGPVSDAGSESYTNYMREPVTLGLTLGELAMFFNGEQHIGANLTVVPMRGWQRGLWFDQTGVPWVNPSPNLQSLRAAAIYPGIALGETTNISVGRGTDTPFEQIGAAWIDAAAAEKVAATLNARKIPGVTFNPSSFTPAKPYPFAGETVHGIRITGADRQRTDAPELGIEILSTLHAHFPEVFQLAKANRLVVNAETMSAIAAGKDARDIATTWESQLADFRERRIKYFLYGYLPALTKP